MPYATIADVKQYLGIISTDDDTLLTTLLDSAVNYIETYTSRVFEGTETSKTFDYTYLYDSYINPREDVASITSVTLNGNAIDYKAYPLNTTPKNLIWLEDYDRLGLNDTVTITGIFAYSAVVPNDIKFATIRLAAYFYKQKDAQTYDVTTMPELGVMTIPKGIPADIKILLDKYVCLISY